MKKMKNYLLGALIAALSVTAAGCKAANADSSSEVTAATQASAESAADTVDLSGHTLLIYCGAGMTKPFQEIADAFKGETGCEMQVTFANAGQIQAQINTAQEGDFFIAGSSDELKPVEDVVLSSISLVRHIPVLAVSAGNPKNISGLADLANPDITVVLGDSAATPIGKIADKALTDLGIFDEVNVISRTTTAPAIFTALSLGECDAGIVWKENAKDESVEIVSTADLEPYEKTVPAAKLSYSADEKAAAAFLEFLQNDKAKDIWIKYGYEIFTE